MENKKVMCEGVNCSVRFLCGKYDCETISNNQISPMNKGVTSKNDCPLYKKKRIFKSMKGIVCERKQ